MKKFTYVAYITFCSVLVILLVSSSVYAEESANITNIKVLSPAANAVLNVQVYNYTTGQVEDSITWSNISQGWKLADQCLKISFSTDAYPWGIQIYTDNKNNTAPVPVYEGHSNPAGLVGCITKDQALPLAWKAYLDGDYDEIPSDLSDISWEPGGSAPSIPEVGERDNGTNGFMDWRWHWLKDKNTPDDGETTDIDESFKDGGEYVTLWNQAGVKWNEGGRHHRTRSIYVFLSADFSTATKQIYKTNTLTVELAHEYPIKPFPMYIYKNAFATEEYIDMGIEGLTLENHYTPAGWMNGDVNMSVNDLYTNNPHSPPHCFKIRWNGNPGDDGYLWNGLAWLEPGLDADGNWIIDERGYNLRGVTHLSFWARTDPQYDGAKIKCYLGHEDDSSGLIPPYVSNPDLGWFYTLSSEWKYFMIPIYYPPYYDYDMSHISVGFVVVLGETGRPSGGYTVYLDDIRFLGPEPVLKEYTFPAGGTQGWSFHTQPNYQAPTGSSGDGYLRITGPGTFESPGSYGCWQTTVMTNVENQKLYRAEFKMGTDIANRTEVPQFRLRVNSVNSQMISIATIRSLGDSTTSPAAGGDKTYEVYFTLPAGSTEDSVSFTFDYLNIYSGDSQTGAMDLKNVTFKEATNVIDVKEMEKYTFAGSSTDGWNFYTSPAYQPAVGIPGDGYLCIKGPGEYGYWESPLILNMESQRLYKAVFKIGTDIADRTKFPKIQLGINSGNSVDWQMASTTLLQSLGDSSTCPASGDDKTYQGYFTLPAGSTEDSIRLRFEYVNFNPDDSQTGAIDLKEVIVYEETRDALP